MFFFSEIFIIYHVFDGYRIKELRTVAFSHMGIRYAYNKKKVPNHRWEAAVDLKNQIELLTQLGLTTNQAKIYLACANYKASTVKQISQSANLATEVVYRTIPKVQRMSLVEKTVAFPAEFQATPINTAIATLLEQRRKENSEVQKKAKELLRYMAKRKKGKHIEDFKIVLIPEKDRQIQFTEKKMKNIQRSLHAIGMGQKFSTWIHTYHDLVEELLAKKIEVRFVFAGTEKRSDSQILKDMQKDGNFKIKFISDKIRTCLMIADDREVLIDTSPDSGFAHTPVYWSNDPGIIAPCKTYFQKYWKEDGREEILS
jgi:sugar-specific transcriptional regulator TrmB